MHLSPPDSTQDVHLNGQSAAALDDLDCSPRIRGLRSWRRGKQNRVAISLCSMNAVPYHLTPARALLFPTTAPPHQPAPAKPLTAIVVQAPRHLNGPDRLAFVAVLAPSPCCQGSSRACRDWTGGGFSVSPTRCRDCDLVRPANYNPRLTQSQTRGTMLILTSLTRAWGALDLR
jgi:hypothetical protein